MKKLIKPCDITAIIITYNEEKHISRCIDSLKHGVKKVFVLDSFSKDGTLKILKKKKIQFKQKKFKNYANQFNSAIQMAKIKTKWVLRIDADEYLEKKFFLKLNIHLNKLNNSINGVNIIRRYIFNNKEIKYGGVFPQKKLRIWKNNKAKCEGYLFDDDMVCEPKVVDLDISIYDHNLMGFKKWILKHKSYANFELQRHLQNKKQINFKKIKKFNNYQKKIFYNKNILYYNFPILIRPLFLFLYRYFYKLGFLDGLNGFTFSLVQTFYYRSLVDIMIIKFYLKKFLLKNEKY